MSANNASPIWKKRGTPQTADWVTRFTVGDDPLWDTHLIPYDIRASLAHAQGLVDIGVLTPGEFKQIEEALDALQQSFDQGDVRVAVEDEDCHTYIENYLTKKLGEVGKKIHAGRSRNDQVLAALRLFLREQLQACGAQTSDLVEVLCDIADEHDDALMPGYTHMQRAMPSTAGLWAMGYAELLADDLDHLKHAFKQINVSPLGSAAGYGVPHLTLPREQTAERLGFRKAHIHPTTVQLTRGKLELTVVNALVQVAATLNRMASDLTLYATSEYGFVTLPEAYTTGSSIMPQKRNPDVLELARATYHRLTSNAHQLTTLPANLPSGYHRDLQLSKAPVMKSTFTASDLLTAVTEVMRGISFNRDRMQEACTPELFATSQALKSVKKGVPFREAYQESAAAVDQLEAPDPADALSAYEVAGYPGMVDCKSVQEQAQSHHEWIEAS